MNILYAITLTVIILLVLVLGLSVLMIDDKEEAPDWVKITAVIGAIISALLVAASAIGAVWVWLVI